MDAHWRKRRKPENSCCSSTYWSNHATSDQIEHTNMISTTRRPRLELTGSHSCRRRWPSINCGQRSNFDQNFFGLKINFWDHHCNHSHVLSPKSISICENETLMKIMLFKVNCLFKIHVLILELRIDSEDIQQTCFNAKNPKRSFVLPKIDLIRMSCFSKY